MYNGNVFKVQIGTDGEIGHHRDHSAGHRLRDNVTRATVVTRTRDDDHEMQQTVLQSMKDGGTIDASGQANLSRFCAEDSQSLSSVDLTNSSTYRLVCVVSSLMVPPMRSLCVGRL